MEIRIDLRSAVIILLAVVVLVLGSYFYRGYELQAREMQVQILNNRINNTQTLLSQLQFNPNVAQLFKERGWKIKEISPPQPTPTPNKGE